MYFQGDHTMKKTVLGLAAGFALALSTSGLFAQNEGGIETGKAIDEGASTARDPNVPATGGTRNAPAPNSRVRDAGAGEVDAAPPARNVPARPPAISTAIDDPA